MWELWFKFYLGKIEDFRPGASTSDISERLLQTGSGGGCSVTQFCPSLCDPMGCNMPGFPVLHHLLELAQTHVDWVGDAILPSHPLSSPFPPALNVSQHHGLSRRISSLHMVAKALELQHQSFQWIVRADFLYYYWLLWSLAVQRTLKSLLQHHSSKASMLCHSAFFMFQLLHPYMTTGKTVALTILTFVG